MFVVLKPDEIVKIIQLTSVYMRRAIDKYNMLKGEIVKWWMNRK